MAESPIVWLIEDDEEQANLFRRLVERRNDLKLVVKFVSVRPNIEDYADLVSDKRTGALIFDQRLDRSGVAYEGIEAATFWRGQRPELPIFILTQHEDDDLLRDQEAAVEFIMEKGKVSDEHERDVYVTRILRHMGRYAEALTEKQKRLQVLVDKSLSDDLSEAERDELQALRHYWERPFAGQMMQQAEAWEKDSQEQAHWLAEISRIAKDIRQTLEQSE